MNTQIQNPNHQAISYVMPALAAIVIAALILFAPEAFAQGGGAGAKVTSFFDNIISILKGASIAIVTIAFMFAGYQVAFAHKRMTDVAPVLIGGLVVGGAAQFAAMLLE